MFVLVVLLALETSLSLLIDDDGYGESANVVRGEGRLLGR